MPSYLGSFLVVKNELSKSDAIVALTGPGEGTYYNFGYQKRYIEIKKLIKKRKMNFLDFIQEYITDLRRQIPNLIISGDYNICHKAIDIHDPIRNKNVSGFLPVEREWLQKFIDSGFIDSFRQFNLNPNKYSWWTYRANARANNKGWRIDYIMVSSSMRENLQSANILSDVVHSDHCPIKISLKV